MYIISTRVDVCRKCWESYSLQSRHQRLQTEAFLKVFLEAVPNPWIERISVSIRSTLCGIEYIIYIFFFFKHQTTWPFATDKAPVAWDSIPSCLHNSCWNKMWTLQDLLKSDIAVMWLWSNEETTILEFIPCYANGSFESCVFKLNIYL